MAKVIINKSTSNAGWRLVHNNVDVITFEYFPAATVTETINFILEFETKELGLAKIAELNLNFEEPMAV